VPSPTPIAYLTRTVEFRATHRYFRPEWNERKNAEVFGSSASPHAHAYQCAVTVRGAVDPATGMVVDLAALDRILAEEVVARFDGRDINRDVAEYGPGRVLPTGEELCLDVWRRVSARLPAGCTLTLVRVQEQPSLFAEYRGEA
jgi:6-pyruvoyltetrahydropterin/6-carboxytetrahydropterin synthase